MKKHVLLMCAVLFVLFFVSRTNAQQVSCTASLSSGNPEGIAVGAGAIWVANYAENNVEVYNASNCALITTVSVGSEPRGVAFASTGVWVSNSGSNTVTEIDSSNYAVLGTYTVGSGPWSIIAAAGGIWVSNSIGNTVTLLTDGGQLLGNFPVGGTPHGLAGDPTAGGVWVANNASNNVMFVGNNGDILYTVATGTQPNWVTLDADANVWVSCWESQEVDEISSQGVLLRRISVSGHGGPEGLAYDSADGLVWGVTWNGTLFSINSSGGTAFYSVSGPSGKNLWNITYDGSEYLWVSAVDNKEVFKILP